MLHHGSEIGQISSFNHGLDDVPGRAVNAGDDDAFARGGTHGWVGLGQSPWRSRITGRIGMMLCAPEAPFENLHHRRIDLLEQKTSTKVEQHSQGDPKQDVVFQLQGPK